MITTITSRETVLYDCIARLERSNKELLEGLQDIVAMENTESDEWDAVERVIPEMCDVARKAIARATNKGEKHEQANKSK